MGGLREAVCLAFKEAKKEGTGVAERKGWEKLGGRAERSGVFGI